MINKIKHSLSLIDYKLILSLMLVQLVPTVYTTLRVFFLGQLPDEYSFSIEQPTEEEIKDFLDNEWKN